MENILNIVNFVRAAEPRDRSIDLLLPVRKQIELMRKYNLRGTFLLQYDAMLREDVVELMRSLDPAQFELGIWLELSQPHVEAVGLKWRGREGFEWDWHAHVDYPLGYQPEERFKLVDLVFAKFEELFGRPAVSVGSWMIDACTLGYMADRYHIQASCNCKDQWGTDGYTIWGGYWNQAYYPSRNNALCPAQSPDRQIPVPVFRMLGSDPVTQYDLGLKIEDSASECQSVASLEPVYGSAGSNPKWVDWFTRQNFYGGSLAFAYAQAGQENSFGWPKMSKGLEYQFPLFAKLRDEGRLRVEPLGESGRWFSAHFPMTPATAVSALEPYEDGETQSIWYNCRSFRANLYRNAAGTRLRDLFLFDDRQEELYLHAPCETEYLVYENLPLIDGNRMSGHGTLAGGWLVGEDGKHAALSPLIVSEDGDTLTALWEGGSLCCDPSGLTLKGGLGLSLEWDSSRCALTGIDGDRLLFAHKGVSYALRVRTGFIQSGDTMRLVPENGVLRLIPERL